MKLYVIILLFMLSLGVTMNAQTYSTSFSWDDVTITQNEKNYDEITMTGCELIYDLGSPRLPVWTVSLIIPKDEDVKKINISSNV